MLIKKEYRRFIGIVKTISLEFQHALVIADIGKRKMRKVVKKTRVERRMISFLKDVEI